MGSPVENISNIVISLLEDLLVAALAFFALRFPLVANGITIVLLVLLITLVPQLLRWAWFTAGATIGWLRSLVAPRTQPDPLPAEHAALLSAPALLSVQCQAQNARLIGGKQGLSDTLRHGAALHLSALVPQNARPVARTTCRHCQRDGTPAPTAAGARSDTPKAGATGALCLLP
ncbi:MAG: hypothetical protein HC884_05460 [Chloroflexaceae bacterium]|nr:hypothetical protein [Chloroflexaceae bacterium]